MKTLTVRLPEALIAQIEAELQRRNVSKSNVVRERLTLGRPPEVMPSPLGAIADLVGAVEGLAPDLSKQTKRYLKSTGYGDKRAR